MAKKAAAAKEVSIHEASVQELEAKLRENQEQYFRLKFRHVGNPLKNPMQIRTTRRDIARIKTVLNQKNRGAA